MKKIFCIIVIVSIIVSCEKKVKSINISSLSEKQNGITKFNFYKKNGKLEKTLEYIDICGNKYLNQGWYFNDYEDTLSNKGNYFKIYVEKKILRPTETSKITILYKPLRQNTICGILISKNISIDYCNLTDVKLDTIYFINNKLEFYQGFKSKGKTNIGGYILEISDRSIRVDNHKEFDERKVYFNIPFEVK